MEFFCTQLIWLNGILFAEPEHASGNKKAIFYMHKNEFGWIKRVKCIWYQFNFWTLRNWIARGRSHGIEYAFFIGPCEAFKKKTQRCILSEFCHFYIADGVWRCYIRKADYETKRNAKKNLMTFSVALEMSASNNRVYFDVDEEKPTAAHDSMYSETLIPCSVGEKKTCKQICSRIKIFPS